MTGRTSTTMHYLHVDPTSKLLDGAPRPKANEVPCFELKAVLTPDQFELLKPFLRATFTETWKVLCVASTGAGVEALKARQALRSASGISQQHEEYERCSAAEGLEIEKRLYTKACAMVPSAPVVWGPSRS